MRPSLHLRVSLRVCVDGVASAFLLLSVVSVWEIYYLHHSQLGPRGLKGHLRAPSKIAFALGSFAAFIIWAIQAQRVH